MRAASRRQMVSDVPPGGNPVMNLAVSSELPCASAGKVSETTAEAPPAMKVRRCIVVSGVDKVSHGRALYGEAWQATRMGVRVTIPHKLSRAEARRRIETGFSNILRQVPGSAGTCSESWDGDRLAFRVGAMGQVVSGVVDVLDDAVTMDIELPGVLGLLAGALKGKLESAGQLLLK
jgi:hypothetical protein